MANICTGIKSLDKLIGGLSTGKLYAVCSRPRMGKTAFGLSICTYVAFMGELPTAFFSLESSIRNLLKRMTLMGYNDITKHTSLVEWSSAEIQSSIDYPYTDNDSSLKLLHIDDNPLLPPTEVIERIIRLVRTRGVQLVYIDYLELLLSHNQDKDREICLRMLKQVAKDYDIAIVISSRLHRYSLNQDDRNPIFCDRHKIIYPELKSQCDFTLVLHGSPEFYLDEEYIDKNKLYYDAEIHVLSRIDGYLGYIAVDFSRKRIRFEDHRMK